MTVHIAVDLLGGDLGVKMTLPSCLAALKKDKQLKISAIVDNPDNYLRYKSNRLDFVPAESVVTMEDSPLKAMRHKINSTMGRGLALVKDSVCDAMISAGNTGALVALGHRVLGAKSSKTRSAIMTTLPSRNGDVYLLDSGANVKCTPEMLHEFALNAQDYIRQKSNPKIGILNIGSEISKGNELTQKTSQLLSEDPSINYVGFVEPRDVLRGDATIVVCDGFTGNIFLKTMESSLELLLFKQRKALDKFFITRLLSNHFMNLIQKLKTKYSRSKYTYGVVLGLNGRVYKAHGSSKMSVFTESLLHIAGHIRLKNFEL